MKLENCNEKCGNWETCKGTNLYDICSCLVYDLNAKGILHVSNGSEGLSIIEHIFNILRHNSTDKSLRDSEDMNVPKPKDFVADYVNGVLNEINTIVKGQKKLPPKEIATTKPYPNEWAYNCPHCGKPQGYRDYIDGDDYLDTHTCNDCHKEFKLVKP